jgi:ribonucleoside-diphosphate reductase alpha chain
MGWHTYLQDKDLPFISITSKNLMEEIGSYMKTKGDEYNIKYGKIFGSPEWCDFNRNLCLFAIAPTTNTALVLGGVSQEIEPIVCNAWIQKSAKGTFIRRNSRLVRLMETKYLEHNNEEFWNNLAIKYKGSIQNFSFFTDDEKRYF